MWPGSPAVTGHQRDVQGLYMVLNAIYAKEWTTRLTVMGLSRDE